ncbi:glycerate kinase type-2 family protein [Dichotomicrobium thermohalophilum]|uniref:Glycerate 2-kinase n=1 Tax=Dichotomicrobium thermohalophilum TaxID=933063 RepID=A0A397Q877_9HYPH|nr:glycerate kinase [Dichotomicrobium thermohalophilum]RIA56699.1 glycerate 2-kinase [Dichotomicrobium thermohalophilum]
MAEHPHRTDLIALFETAVARAQPGRCLPGLFPDWPGGRIIVIACGKAGAAMARVAEEHYADAVAEGRYQALAVTRHGYGVPLEHTRLIEAGHPVPDDGSLRGAEAALEAAGAAGADDLVLVLLSGGASALCAAPVAGLTLDDKRALTQALLRSGATISQINCVRKHLSGFKGGRLAAAAAPSRVMTLAISDVPGDAPDAIGSGPTVPDPTTLADARKVLGEFDITPGSAVAAALNDPANETPKPGDDAFANAEYRLAATAAQSLDAAAEEARARGYRPVILGDALEGEARDLAKAHAAQALELQRGGERIALLSGGEATVTIRGDGQGGPNQEYALALAIALDGAPGIHALAADTDGSDGGTGAADDPAGAITDSTTLARAAEANLDPATFLQNNDSQGFFRALGDLLITGPTQTNVNDFRTILVEPPGE